VSAARTLINRLAGGEYEAVVAGFDDTMKAQLPASTLEATWNQLTSQFGQLVSLGEAEVSRSAPYDIVVVECTFEKGLLAARVVFDT
jgi:hypothetical protein